MNSFIVVLFIIGLVTFSMAWMPFLSKKLGVSYSVFYMAAGVLLYWLFPDHLPSPLPQENESVVLHLTELIVIISLMGAGLKIKRTFSLKNWSLPLRLVFIGMLLGIVVSALLGYFMLGLNLAAALLLAAVLAPTDPVLASDVQVSPPNEKKDSETKFALTAEAGINDGLAFPFTWLAITVAAISAGIDDTLWSWLTFHFIYKIVAGLIAGFLLGKAAGYLIFDFSKKYKFLEKLDGFVALSMTLLVYGLTEMIHGYGFIAVFVSALTLRNYEKNHEYHESMHSFTDQVERIFVVLLLMLFGGAISLGVLENLTWNMVFFVLLLLLVIRPVVGYLSLLGTDISKREKLTISFFGIRGLGSIFYLAFAFQEISFEYQDELWSIVSLTVALSILIHGLTVSMAMKKVGD
ncbi:NhaP-type Na+/H+ or K+/H+ antiporter [Algoriphagus ratkowskyi]|uniref:NhaP-type Na+/H+ or K+/H+ antiporter n=1 Tax=Algoriphagus ratkowskyi TaxID=57028 RepID=A0A2W7S897_9BACT|nr:cation:proton antiporter [Algoriphagus ratkowskyi]PZX59155.1 NhaP-type Na+/H+ or K+/H+ antiporter [Algoriphagus ratkowskyi]TXD77560.1 sodium:proton antiporter [Algoriphagus ratkowskyi]